MVSACVVVSVPSTCEEESWLAALPKSTRDVLGSSVVQVIATVPFPLAAACVLVITGPVVSVPYVAV